MHRQALRHHLCNNHLKYYRLSLGQWPKTRSWPSLSSRAFSSARNFFRRWPIESQIIVFVGYIFNRSVKIVDCLEMQEAPTLLLLVRSIMSNFCAKRQCVAIPLECFEDKVIGTITDLSILAYLHNIIIALTSLCRKCPDQAVEVDADGAYFASRTMAPQCQKHVQYISYMHFYIYIHPTDSCSFWSLAFRNVSIDSVFKSYATSFEMLEIIQSLKS
jgi:hypothetical protein